MITHIDKQQCTKLSILQPQQISNIIEWRNDYNYTNNVNAKQYDSCSLYLIEDKTHPYQVVLVTNTSLLDYPGDEIITKDLKPPNCYHYGDCLVTSIELSSSCYVSDGEYIHILDGIEWELQGGESLTIDNPYVLCYNITKIDLNNHKKNGQVIELTFYQQDIPNTPCGSISGIVGLTGLTDKGYKFSWGVRDTKVTQKYVFNAPNGTFFNSVVANLTSIPYLDECDKTHVISTMYPYAFGNLASEPDYIPNPQLITPFPYYQSGYLYEQIDYEENVTYQPIDLGCVSNNDYYDESNMINFDVSQRRRLFYSIFITVCLIISFIAIGIQSAIKYQKLVNPDDESSLQDMLHDLFMKTSFGKVFYQVILCGWCKDHEWKGYITLLISVFVNGSLFPITILAPEYPRLNHYGCFNLWEGVFNSRTLIPFALMWLVWILATIAYTILGLILKDSSVERKACGDQMIYMGMKFMKFIFQLSSFLILFGSFFMIYILSLVTKVIEAQITFTIILTGVNFQRFFPIWNALVIDKISPTFPLISFLFYQFCRFICFIGYVFDIIMSLHSHFSN